MKHIISNRIADADIYNNRLYYDEPKEYYKLVLTEIVKKFEIPNSLLDIGCANGSFLHHAQTALIGTKLFGAEPVVDLVDIARKNTLAEIIKYGLFDIPEDRQYEIITMLGVLGIFSDVVDVLTKLKKLIKPGGYFYFFTI